ncbi:hypothetical protein EDB85DRAFT_1897183 [Lactarius pseudohatsudake]|nr:hypothetical protein EDB85DRAFT_1897183 [Lactarius pseudohatsudake]
MFSFRLCWSPEPLFTYGDFDVLTPIRKIDPGHIIAAPIQLRAVVSPDQYGSRFVTSLRPAGVTNSAKFHEVRECAQTRDCNTSQYLALPAPNQHAPVDGTRPVSVNTSCDLTDAYRTKPVNYAYRPTDGSDDNPFIPSMGEAGSPYARSVPSLRSLPLASLPSADLREGLDAKPCEQLFGSQSTVWQLTRRSQQSLPKGWYWQAMGRCIFRWPFDLYATRLACFWSSSAAMTTFKRSANRRFADADVAHILQNARALPAHAFGARGMPEVLHVVELFGTEQGQG